MREMLRRVPRFLLIVGLGGAFFQGSVDSQSASMGQSGSVVVLTAARPVVRLPVPARALQEKRTSLAISVVSIKTPDGAVFSINVSLHSVSGDKSSPTSHAKSAEIGVLGIYPAGQTGDYRLEASTALRRLRAFRAAPNSLFLRVELRPMHTKELPDDVEVTLSSPRWLRVD